LKVNDSPELDLSEIRPLLERALAEDIGAGDLTTEMLVPSGTSAQGVFIARAGGVLAGGILLQPLFGLLDRAVVVELKMQDGSSLRPGDLLAGISGPAPAILSGERQALNFLARLSGVASLTRRYVEAVKGTRAEIFDTRKTTPGWRVLEKYAVRMGGGKNHRMGLYDQILIKDNHLRLASRQELARAIARARKERPGLLIEMEVESLEELKEALKLGLDIIMLDNMTAPELEQAVRMVKQLPQRNRPILEASGGINLENVREIALTGVDRISVGALSHSAPALDISLELGLLGQHRKAPGGG
jgi:nicotinate-nucleotide pyrophosphorylase (carboxylating)